jgi:hypothetical protein
MNLIFNESDHSYRLNDRIVPSVTTVINSIMPGWKADEWYKHKGRMLHRACQLLSENRLDWNSVDPVILPRVQAWQRFLKDSKAEVIATEKKVANELHQYAGMVDVLLVKSGQAVVCDMKSTWIPQVKIQLAGYVECYPSFLDCFEKKLRKRPQCAVAVELRENGQYSAHWLESAELRHMGLMFLQCRSIYGFKQKEGL